MCDIDEVKGTIIPDLVDDVSKVILNLVGVKYLFELRMVSKAWLDIYKSFRPTQIISQVHPYFQGLDYVVDSTYNKYKPMMDKLIDHTKKLEMTIDIHDIMFSHLIKLNSVNKWIRSMISHYIKKGDIANLHNLIKIHDHEMCYSSVCEDETILIQALETKNEMMIKYCFYRIFKSLKDGYAIRFTLPDYVDLGKLPLYYDFSVADPYNRTDVIKYLKGNVCIPPRYKTEILNDTKFMNEEFELFGDDVDEEDVSVKIFDYTYDFCSDQINKILDSIEYGDDR